jgi:hypothetical protein
MLIQYLKVHYVALDVFLIFIKKEKIMRIVELELFIENNFLFIIMY